MDKPRTLRVLLTGGGSGGHVYPLIAVAQKLQERAKEVGVAVEFHYYGPRDRFTEIIARDLNIAPTVILAGKMRRYLSLMNLIDLPKVFLSFFQVCWKMLWLMPDVIFSKGGTGALPVVVVGWWYRVPVVVHESDFTPGITTLLSIPFARRFAVSFENAAQYFRASKVVVTGAPVRRALVAGTMSAQDDAKRVLGFRSEEPLTLVIGASQGSRRINEFMFTNLQELLAETQLLHQVGPKNFLEAQRLTRAALMDISVSQEVEHRYKVVPYFEVQDLRTALIAADLVVARPGSSTLFELAAFGKPAILVPIAESANDHQRANAYEFAKGGAAVVIEEENLLPAIFTSQLRTILGDPEKLKAMGEASRRFAKPGAAEMIAEEILGLAGYHA